jgi:ubiquinone/menaquinone biosynthesis C-methylase UbiE
MSIAASKKDLVKEVFENPRRYFGGRQYDVRIRAETVKLLAEGLQYRRVLDIGCGDGSISLPLLTPGKTLTLMDLSENMLSVVRANMPRELAGNVEILSQDFMTASLCPEFFDLIICIGVMAHVDSTEEFVEKIATLIKPGGSLILEFTDAFCLAGRVSRFFRGVKESIAPPRYSVNLLSFDKVSRLVSRHGLRLISQFRYGLPPLPGIMQFLSHETRYEIVRRINGTCRKSRNKWCGSEYICLLTLDRPRGSE